MKIKKTLCLVTALLTALSGNALHISAAQATATDTRGDLDANGEISVDDAQNILMAYVRRLAQQPMNLTAAQLTAADIDRNGLVEVADAQYALEYYVCMNAKHPKTWEQIIKPEVQSAENKIPETGKQMTVLCWTSDDLNKMISHFETSHPEYKGKVKFVQVGNNGGEAREQYASYFAGNGDVDLFMLEQDWMRDYTDNDEYTAPITDLGFTESDFSECYPYTLAVGKNTDNVLKGVTWQATPGGYCYRTDLAKQYLGVTSPTEMQNYVKDWTTFENTAKTVYSQSGGKTAMIDTWGGFWQVSQYNFTKPLADSNDLLNVSGTDFTTLTDRFCRFWDNGYICQTADQWFDEWYDIGQDGSTMGYFFCTWCLGEGSMLEHAEGGTTGSQYGKYRICQGPSPWAWGGYWIALSPKADNGQIAHDFIQHFVCDQAKMEDYALQNGEFVNNSAANKAIAGKMTNPRLGGQSAYTVLDANASAIDLDGKITRFDAQIKNAFSYALQKYANGNVYDEAGINDYFATEAAKIEGLTVDGAKPYTPPASSMKDNGSTLTIGCWTSDDVGKMITNFENTNTKYKGKVKWVSIGSSAGEARENYASYLASGYDLDLLILEEDWMRDYTDNDSYTAPLSALGFSDIDFADNVGYTVKAGKNKNGVQKAISWQATPGCYCYRTDLAQKYLGVTTPAEMQKYVKDWDTFGTTAQTVYAKSGGKTAMVDTVGGLWQVWQSNFNPTDGKGNLDSGYFKAFADVARQYWSNGYVTKEFQWTKDWYDIGQDGSTMGYFFCNWCLGKGSMLEQAEGGTSSSLYGTYRAVAGPSDWHWGGSWIAVNSRTDNKTMAHDFIQHFCVNPTTMESYARYSGDYVANQSVMNKVGFTSAALGGQNLTSVIQLPSGAYFDATVTPNDAAIMTIYYSNIQDYIKGAASYQTCYNRFVNEVTSLGYLD